VLAQDLHLNAGAARIPHQDTGLIAHCQEFDILLEVFVSNNRATLLQAEFAFGASRSHGGA
jgi:hypothetical protein